VNEENERIYCVRGENLAGIANEQDIRSNGCTSLPEILLNAGHNSAALAKMWRTVVDGFLFLLILLLLFQWKWKSANSCKGAGRRVVVNASPDGDCELRFAGTSNPKWTECIPGRRLLTEQSEARARTELRDSRSRVGATIIVSLSLGRGCGKMVILCTESQ